MGRIRDIDSLQVISVFSRSLENQIEQLRQELANA